MAEISDADVQAALADESTPAPLRAAYEALRADLETERANRLQVERRVTFAEAGLADHPARELLETAYEAGMTAEALKETAAKYGLLNPAADSQAPEDRSDLDALRRVGQATQGTPGAAPTLSFDEEVSRARSPKEVLSVISRRGDEVGLKLAETSKQGHRIV